MRPAGQPAISFFYLFIQMSACPSFRPSIHSPVCPSVCYSSVRSFVHLSVRSSVCPCVCPSIHPSVCLLVPASVCLFVCTSVRSFLKPTHRRVLCTAGDYHDSSGGCCPRRRPVGHGGRHISQLYVGCAFVLL